MNLLFTLACCFILTTTVSQNSDTDSVHKLLLAASTDTQKVALLSNLIDMIDNEEEWRPLNDQMGEIATRLMSNSNAIFQHTGKIYYATYCNNAGLLQQNMGNLDKALQFYFQGLKLYEACDDKLGTANTLNNIGTLYDEQGDWQQALINMERSYDIMKSLNDSAGMATTLNNIGTIYNNHSKPILALEYFQKSLRLHRQNGDLQNEALVLANIGGVYDKLDSDKVAYDFYHKSYVIQKAIDDEPGLCYAAINFGNLSMKQKKWIQAEEFFNEALQRAQNIQFPLGMLGAMDFLSRMYAAKGDYQKAFNMEVNFKHLTDSLRNDDTRKQLLKKQMQYDYEKREAILKIEQKKKNELAVKEVEKQKSIRNTILIAANVIFFISLYAFYIYRRKREVQMKHQLAELNMRAISAQINPHFIFNCMQSIQTFIAKKDLTAAGSSLLLFAKLIRKVLDHSMSRQISLHDELETLQDYVSLEKSRLDHPLLFDIFVEKKIDTEETFLPPLLLQPIVENAIVHGIKPKAGAGTIHLKILQKGKQLSIEITDNGIGRRNPDKSSAHKSHGISLTQERLKCLQTMGNATSEYSVEDLVNEKNEPCGTKITLLLPLNNQAA